MVDMGELEETERQAARPFWMRVRFYQILIPLLVSAILILVGVLLAAYQPVSVSFLWSLGLTTASMQKGALPAAARLAAAAVLDGRHCSANGAARQ